MHKRAWRELGFWYDYTPKTGWVIRGNKAGLGQLPALLDKYASDPGNTPISEHDHYGPYMYLKFVTWSSPEINSDGFYGSLDDLRRLAALARNHLAAAAVGATFELSRQYSEASVSALTVHVEVDSFDPASVDLELL